MTSLYTAAFYLQFIFQGYCQFIYTSASLESRYVPKDTYILFFIASTLEFAVYEAIGSTYYYVILYALLTFIICCICYASHIGNIVLHCFILTVIFILTNINTQVIINLIIHNNYNTIDPQTKKLLMLTISDLFMFVISMLIKFSAEKNIIQTKSLFLSVIPIFNIITVYGIVLLSSKYDFDFRYEMVSIIAAVSFITINAVTFIVHESFVNVSEETERLKLLEQKKEIDFEYYKLLQKNYEDSRVAVHDMKHHVEVLKLLSKEGSTQKIQEYLETLSNSQFFTSKRPLTRNKIIDVVIYQKSEICRNKNIALSFEGNNISLDFVEEPDICCILSNLLDNAAEAAEKSEAKKIKLIFHSNGQNEIYFISIDNSCDSPPVISGKNLITNKKDTNKHGIGIYSVKQTIKKYNGDIDYEYDENKKEFHITVMLHKKQRKSL